MPLDALTLLPLAAACAPQVPPDVLLAIAQVESGRDPLAIGVNGPAGGRLYSRTADEAAARAARLIAAGRSVDLGLGQINSRNLPWLGLSVREAFDPCRNLAASARVLRHGFARATADHPQARLDTALSYYNTGHPRRGQANGYVLRVRAAAARWPAPAAAPPVPVIAATAPAWDVFGRPRDAAAAPLVFASGAAS